MENQISAFELQLPVDFIVKYMQLPFTLLF